MKLLSYLADGVPRYGVVNGDAIVDLASRHPALPTLRDYIGAGLPGLGEAAGEAGDLPLAGIRYLPVIPNPAKILCVGLNYRDHVEETGRTVTEKPTYFCRYPASQVGHGEPVVRPLESERFDYEGELAVIIGKPGRRIAPEKALSHIAGYACYNEGSVRDWQRHTSQFLPGKTFDSSGSFGPFMVTADEIPDPAALTLETRLNGAVMQHTTTDLMITPIPELIHYISTVLALEAGDVIVSGTPGGVGSRREPPVWLKPGDTVEVEISGVGLLSNPVIDEADA